MFVPFHLEEEIGASPKRPTPILNNAWQTYSVMLSAMFTPG